MASTATQERRANSLSSPPNTSVPPATIKAISEIERATGPVKDCATALSGVSQGRPPPPPPPAHAERLRNNSSGANLIRLAIGSHLYLHRVFAQTYSTRYRPRSYPVTTSSSRTFRRAAKLDSSSMNTTKSTASAISACCGAAVASATRLSSLTKTT